MAIITICAGVFCHGYINGFSISKYDRFYSYAEADNWTSCDTSDLVTAFRYYCKSRNLALEGSAADALTSFTTNTFNNICSTLGIDPTQLQAELKKTTNGNLGLRFLFSQTGINAYNRIFAEFLQNNDLEVGEQVDDKELWSAESYNGSIIWECNDVETNAYNWDSVVIKQGSYYKYTSAQLSAMSSGASVPFPEFNVNLNIFNGQLGEVGNIKSSQGVALYKGSLSDWVVYTYGVSGSYVFLKVQYSILEGYPILVHVNGSDRPYHLCLYQKTNQEDNGRAKSIRELSSVTFSQGDVPENENVYVTTNNNTINNNNYNNNFTIIYNDGDTYVSDDDDEPLPTTPPGGGGGGSDNPGGDPDNWNPTTPTIPEPTNPNFPTVNLPDIDIPDLPSLNFSLGDLRNKFPFSLPFDIIAVLNVLDGEPQAPHIEATVPIGRWYTWEMDFDFSEFDNYARIFRAFEFIGFCIGLAVFTFHVVKG